MKKIELKVVPLAIALVALGFFRELPGHKVSAEEQQAPDPRIAGASSEQLHAAEEDLRTASKKMDELMAAAATLPTEGGTELQSLVHRLTPNARGGINLRDKATRILSGIKRGYDEMAQRDPGSAAKRYRREVEGKTIYDFAGPEARPEYVAAVNAAHGEVIRLHKTMISSELAWYQFIEGVHGLSDEVRRRFPNDRLAQMNWFVDQVRDKKSEDLTRVLGLARGFSNEQMKVAEENRLIAAAKMRELMIAAEKLSKDQKSARFILAKIRSDYNILSKADPVAAATWYRKQVEGKTIDDITGTEEGPEFVAPPADAPEALKVAAAAVNQEKIRLYEAAMKEADPAQRAGAIAQHQAGVGGLVAASRKLFPQDKLAQMNWFLDQVRGKQLKDLRAILESARVAAQRAAAAAERDALAQKQELAEALLAIKANEAKVKNAEWHILYTEGVLERSRDLSSYNPMQTRIEGNVLYDYETGRYRVEFSGVSAPKTGAPQPARLFESIQSYNYDGTALRMVDGTKDRMYTARGTIVPDTNAMEGRTVPLALLRQGGVAYFLNGFPDVMPTLPLNRLSTQLETKSKQGQIKVTRRDNGVWVIADSDAPLRLAYDPRKGALLGAQFMARGSAMFSATEGKKPPVELTGVVKIELQQVGEFWPPKTVTYANFQDADSAQRLEFSDVKINQSLPPTAFTLEFPPNTQVFDRINKTHYMVARTVAPPVPAAVSASSPAPPVSPSNPTLTPPFSPSRGSSGWGWTCWTTLALVILATAVLIGVVVVKRGRARA